MQNILQILEIIKICLFLTKFAVRETVQKRVSKHMNLSLMTLQVWVQITNFIMISQTQH